ncbi:MAG: peptidase M1 [Myxococcales bacterium]|nr:peptidase M1 [Myxococcales bacterium]
MPGWFDDAGLATGLATQEDETRIISASSGGMNRAVSGAMGRAIASGSVALVLVVACAAPVAGPDSAKRDPTFGKADGQSLGPTDIESIDLSLDLERAEGTAIIEFGIDAEAVLTVGELDIRAVHDARGPLEYVQEGQQLSLRDSVEGPLTVFYGFPERPSGFDGWLPGSGVTFLWPYFCGNLFPCNPRPADGVRLSAEIRGAASGSALIYPRSIDTAAPPYMFAVATGDYAFEDLGATDVGTRVGVWYLPGGRDDALRGTELLPDAFAFLERTYGDYAFGDEVASVAADWGPGAVGGMEHHPYWHVAKGAMSDPVVHVHEAAHGWYGNGVRIRCWEDFVLSEGVTSYLAARALAAAGGDEVRKQVWADYSRDLRQAVSLGDTEAWPQGACNGIDLLHHPLWGKIPYMKGAFFLRAVADEIGEGVLDGVLRRFYETHVGGDAAGVADLLEAIESDSGFDPTSLAEVWLRGRGVPQTQ